MALPTSGTIWLSQIKDEFGGPNYELGSYYRGGGYTTTNNLIVPTTGQIAFSNFYGAVKATSGGLSFQTGTHYLAIPPYQWLAVDVRGGGGGGGGANIDVIAGTAGADGGASHMYGGNMSVWAGGGTGGAGSNYYAGINYDANGMPQAAHGGHATDAGGGAGGNGGVYGLTHGQRGGNGGRSYVIFNPGDLVVGATLTIIAGGGGAFGTGTMAGAEYGGNGACYISWG